MSDKCPFCESKAYRKQDDGYIQFGCNSYIWNDGFSQSLSCKDRQITNLQASRDRWKELYFATEHLEEITEFAPDEIYNPALKRKHKAIAALKGAGEWEE